MAVNSSIEAAFAEFRRLGADGRQWRDWASLFSDDALYIEHCMGTLHGRAAITTWIEQSMVPVAPMTFSIEWVIFDGDRVAFWIWNHLPDPTGGSVPHDFGNLSLLTYDGDQLICEEDFYSADDSGRTVMGWYKAGGQPTMAANPALRPHALAHPAVGAAVDRSSLAALADRIVADDWRDVVSSHVGYHDHGCASIDTWARSTRAERFRIIGDDRVVVVFDHQRRDGTVQPASVIAGLGADGRAAWLDHCYNPKEVVNP
jgi:hypothetical protein